MASQDVIELGSSDDEPEPAPKRSKPPLNAMVHIPTNLPGVTIKKSKQKNVNGQSSKLALGPRPLRILPKTPFKQVSIPVISAHGKTHINPLSVIKSINNSQIQIKKVQSLNPGQKAVALKRTGNPSPKPQSNVLKRPINIGSLGLASNVVQATNIITKSLNSKVTNSLAQSSKSISRLPPGITVKPIKQINNSMVVSKRVMKRPPLPVAKKKKPNPPSTIAEVLTVELDDDDSPRPNDSPQWYMRPEDQTPDKSLEAKNNKEPATPSFIEITIEDSPIKPVLSKNTNAKKDAITIDDSPAKCLEKDVQNQEEDSGSDHETDRPRKTPNSKKKLQYSKQVNDNSKVASASIEKAASSPNTIEIEVPPLEVEVPKIADINKETVSEQVVDTDIVIEILESPAKKKRKPLTVKPICIPVSNKISEPLIQQTPSTSETSQFHPTYQSFIDLCFQLENSDDMKKIVEKKIKTYYLQVPKDYTESEEFLEMVSSKIMSIKEGPEKMYLYIKDVVDELNLQRKLAKSQAVDNEKKQEKEAAAFYGEELEADTKRKRQVRKLEKTLKKLNRAIHKLEEQEVDFDDDGDSVYILTERYKERLVRVHAKLCQLSNTKMPSEPRVHIEPRPGQPAGPARRLEKFINKRVPVGTPLSFPDFHDVLRFVREANDEDKLGWNEVDIMEEARDLFTRCGKKLQRRRQENEWRLAASRLTGDADPAADSEELKRKLEENRKVSSLKEAELINKYADRQKQLQLEAVEIGDKEAEESPVESGDEAQEEERQEEESLESTEGRKERLKRLIKERSKGAIKNAKPIELDDDEEDNVNNEKTDNAESDPLEKGKESDDGSHKSAVVEEKHDDEAGPSSCADVNIESNTLKDSPNRSGSNDDVHLLSDDSKDDGDELNLLQKLHSGTDVATSTLESSDTDSPIAISDTLGSSDDVQKKDSKHSSDIVSIENSSYSESEAVPDKEQEKEDQNTEEEVVAEVPDIQANDPLQMNDDSDKESPKKSRDSNDEYTERLEDILLASSDDEDTNKTKQPDVLSIDGEDIDDSFVNLKDDSISIGDTVIEGSVEQKSVTKENKTENTDDTTVPSSDEASIDKVNEESKTKSDQVVKEPEPIKDMVVEVSSEPKNDEKGDEESQDSKDNMTVEETIESKSETILEKSAEPQDHEAVKVTDEGDTVLQKSDVPKEVKVVTGSDEMQFDTTNIEPSESSDLISENTQEESEPKSDTIVEKSHEPKHDKDIETSIEHKGDEVTEKSSKPNNDTSSDSKAESTLKKTENGDQLLQDSSVTNKDENMVTDTEAQTEVEKLVTDNSDILEQAAIDKVPISNDHEAKSKEIDSDNGPKEKTTEKCLNNGENEAMDTS